MGKGKRGGGRVYQSVNLALSTFTKEEYGGWDALRQECRELGLDGVEGIWSGEDVPEDFPSELLVGYHLTFVSDWLDSYRDDPMPLVDYQRRDLERAVGLGARYVVFHVSNVSEEEEYTYRWLHSDEEIIDASLEVIDRVLEGVPPAFDFLVENQWWPGFTFTQPDKTARLLSGIRYPRKGIMLDTGHLMNTNWDIQSQSDGLAFLESTLRRHGDLAGQVLGLHLHQSISGTYARTHTGAVPPDLPDDPTARFAVTYQHILNIDRHRPWTDPGVAELVRRVGPRYLTHELAAADRASRRLAVETQLSAIRRGQSGAI